MRRLLVAAVIAASCATAACNGTEGRGGDSDAGGGSDARDTAIDVPPVRDVPDNELPDGGRLIENLTTIQNPSNSLSFFVEWSSSVPATTDLTVDCGEDWTQNYRSMERTTEHRVFVMGLWAGAACRVVASGETESGGRGGASATITAGPIPEQLPEFDVGKRREDAVEPGWTLFNLWNRFDNVPITVVLVDSKGRIRWYHTLSTSNPGPDSSVRRFRDGLLIGGNRGFLQAHIIDWQGNVDWKGSFPMHHEIRPAPNGPGLLYLTDQKGCSIRHPGNDIVKYSWKEDRELDRWKLCEFWQPDQPEPDWAHLNTIEPFPGETSVLLSSRTQHMLFKIDLQADKLVWKMGVKGDFDISGDERFFRQHAPEIQPNGNILLFDNGSLPSGTYSRPWSRVVEISYDVPSKHAEIVWSYRPDPDFFAPIWGDADRLDNGNTLVTFGVRNKNADKNSHLEEVKPDGSVVWRLNLPNRWGVYRSERVGDLPTGSILSN